jgi:hypothetical protein
MHARIHAASLPCENIAVFSVAASPAFALADTVSGFSRHARAIVKAHDIESRLRQRRLILALVLLLACPTIPDHNTSRVLV